MKHFKPFSKINFDYYGLYGDGFVNIYEMQFLFCVLLFFCLYYFLVPYIQETSAQHKYSICPGFPEEKTVHSEITYYSFDVLQALLHSKSS